MTGRALKTGQLHRGMKVGLYGGSFDPPHDAHAHVARTALKRLELDRVWWLVSPGNPFKAHAPAPLADRVSAIHALTPEPRQVASDMEARLGTRRTIDLLRRLQRQHPGVRFVWIMGADGLGELHRWKAWREIVARTPICVVARPGAALKARLGPAARQMSAHRIGETQAHSLVTRGAPGWTYLTEPLHPHASRDIRAART